MRTVAVIGGGYTGAMVCVALAKRAAAVGGIEVVLVEPRETPGQGVAYSASEASLLINVPSARMRPFEAQPADFSDWLGPGAGQAFPPRWRFGQYVTERLQAAVVQAGSSLAFRHIRARAQGLAMRDGRLSLRLDTGACVATDAAVLALGNPPPRPLANLLRGIAAGAPVIDDPWASGAPAGIAADAAVLIVGTGLTMADMVTSLHARGHRGCITAVSRRGLLPHLAGNPPDARTGAMTDHPIDAAGLLRRVRREAALAEQDCGDWRRAVEEVRIALPDIWQRLSPAVRVRLERHAGALWSIHRYRMPPAVHHAVHGAIAAAGLRVIVGRVTGYNGRSATIATHSGMMTAPAAIAINCTGPDHACRTRPNPLLESLFANGLARRGAVGNGLVLDAGDQVEAAPGQAQAMVFAAGPTARHRYGEMTAVTEIGRQAPRIVDLLLKPSAVNVPIA